MDNDKLKSAIAAAALSMRVSPQRADIDAVLRAFTIKDRASRARALLGPIRRWIKLGVERETLEYIGGMLAGDGETDQRIRIARRTRAELSARGATLRRQQRVRKFGFLVLLFEDLGYGRVRARAKAAEDMGLLIQKGAQENLWSEFVRKYRRSIPSDRLRARPGPKRDPDEEPDNELSYFPPLRTRTTKPR